MTNPIHILVVDDEPHLREMVRLALTRNGYRVSEAENAAAARVEVRAAKPSLILLDWMMPGLSGLEFARELKANPSTGGVPIIMLTARDMEAEKVVGLEAGLDDYVTKPFSTKELVARIRAVLRRAAPTLPLAALEIEGLRLDPERHRVTVLEHAVTMGPSEFRLLYFFMTHPERVFSRAQLIQQVWGLNVHVEERTVDVHIRRLRRALTPTGHDRLIQTVRGAGYRFVSHG
ncbi:MAG: phosphate regulon transcriptional regulatory protein PhoB [Gammaproteobacteria bacterium]|nr:phosphate regulon transcriptional regulatory protein PhoB [Gammaproteobacteria bacterium]